LKSLHSSYANFIGTLNFNSIDKDLIFEQLSTKLLQQDKWKKQFGYSSVNDSSEVVLAESLGAREVNKTKRMMEIKSLVNIEKLHKL